ncbi:MAG: MerR family transcriptional regulator [Eggerthellaceae bacterium]|nr:MerR family transcriptional regulator [Eggerthellaceae bacterium]
MTNTTHYTIGELARLAGVSTRTLRHYEALGLLAPERAANGYRVFSERDARRLAHVLSMRACGMPLAAIAELLATDNPNLPRALAAHLESLRAQQQELNQAIAQTQAALARAERIEQMSAEETFKEMKREGLRQFEETYGAEARQRYGTETIEEANERMMGLSRTEWDEKEQLEQDVLAALKAALATGDPHSPEAAQLVELHRRWIGIHWGAEPEPQAYRGLAQGYLADERFVSYYDDPCGTGATAFLVEAVEAALE